MSLSIEVRGASVHFGGVRAVQDANLTVNAGTVTGLIGPNGAGKTTLFNLICQVLKPTSGTILIGGVDTGRMSMAQCAAMGVARTFQTPRGFGGLDVRTNVQVMLPSRRDSFAGALFRTGKDKDVAAAADELLGRVGLSGLAGLSHDRLSGGEQRMLEIARQMALSPKLLLLDEPTAGLDLPHQDRLRELILGLRDRGVTVFIVEHNIGFLMRTVEYLHVMNFGSVIASGRPAEVSADQRVISAYLGRSADAIARA